MAMGTWLPHKKSMQYTSLCRESIIIQLINLQFSSKVCEDICLEIVESGVAELAKETVTTCIDEMVKRCAEKQ